MIKKTTLILIVVSLLLIGGVALARGLVPCGGGPPEPACEPCHIFVLIQNILDFLWWYISIPVATLMFVYGGILIMTSITSPAGKEKGKKVLWNTVIGVLIIFFAWLGVDTIIKAVGGKIASDRGGVTSPDIPTPKYGPWNKIDCIAPVSTSGGAPSRTSPGGSTLSSGITTGGSQPATISPELCPSCVKLSVPYKTPGACGPLQGGGCVVNGELNDRLVNLNRNLPVSYWQVTEAWPPTVVHQNPCHAAGTCVDANLLGSARGNPTEIKNFTDKANAANLRAVYEIPAGPDALRREGELRTYGVDKNNIQIVSGISAEHFSVYTK